MKNSLQYFATIALLFTLLFPVFSANAQAYSGTNYQAVIRNSSNALVANTVVGVKISVLQNTSSGTVIFSETHTTTTNTNGLATFVIGEGAALTGSYLGIDWSAGPYFIKTETDPMGGTNYTISGTSQINTVPYSLWSKNTDYALNSGDSWKRTGNNVDPSTEFIGSINDADIIFKRNNATAGKIGVQNTSIGVGAGELIGSGQGNAAFGNNTLSNISDGLNNTAIGSGALKNLSTGNGNIGLGNNAVVPSSTGSNQLSIGNVLYGTNIGNTTTGTIGIGVPVPTEKLEVAGKTKTTNLQITTGAGVNKVLTSDATGNATWKTSNANTGVYILPTAPQVIPSGSRIPIYFNEKFSDDSNAYGIGSFPNSAWQVPSDGFYHIYATIRLKDLPSPDQMVSLFIQVGGNRMVVVNRMVSNFENFDISASLKLGQGDYVSILVLQNSGVSANLDVVTSIPAYSYFSGYKIY